METGQLKLCALVLVISLGSCARAPAAPAVTPVVLAQNCPVGPHCVTGQVEDRYGTPVGDVRCSVRGEEGEVIEVKSDQRGLFLIDGLTAPPPGARFVKDGYTDEVMVLQPAAAGSAARIYVTLQRWDDGSCTCEPAAIFAGQPPCPEDRCAGDRSRTTPETGEAPP